MIRSVLLATVIAVLGLVGVAPAASVTSPDLDGSWVLDVSRSDYGEFPGANAETLDIRRDGAILHFKVSATVRRSARSYELALPTDGSEVRFPLTADIRIGSAILRSASGVFKGPALVVTEKVQHMDETVVLQTTYTRSADAGFLREQVVQDGAALATMVFRKRSAPA